MLVTSKARLRYVSIPPRKMRLVADLVKGLPVEQALNILDFTPRIAARHIAKTLKSAAANALSLEGTDHLKPESLHVKKITVDAAPMAKRIRFQSMGRAFRYRKRYCHLTVILEGETGPGPGAKPRKRTASARAETDKESGAATKETTGAARKKSATGKKGRTKLHTSGGKKTEPQLKQKRASKPKKQP